MRITRRMLQGFAPRYAAVAATCAVLHNVILIGTAWAGGGVLAAAVVSFCLMVVIGYFLLCGIAFRTVPTRAGFFRYTGVMAANFPLTTALLWVFAVPLRLPVALVAPTVTALMVGINFLSSRWAIKRRRACAS